MVYEAGGEDEEAMSVRVVTRRGHMREVNSCITPPLSVENRVRAMRRVADQSPRSLTKAESDWLYALIARCSKLVRGNVVAPLDLSDAPPWVHCSGQRGAKYEAGSYIYIVEFVDACVKVGITENPKSRLAAHARAARGMGRVVGRTWLSDRPYPEAASIEKDLVAPGVYSNSGEYLDMPFDAVLELTTQAIAKWTAPR